MTHQILPKYKGPLFKLILGKYPVLRVQKLGLGIQRFSIQLGDNLVVIDAPHDADVREGDLLSLYTEVPLVVPQRPPVN